MRKTIQKTHLTLAHISTYFNHSTWHSWLTTCRSFFMLFTDDVDYTITLNALNTRGVNHKILSILYYILIQWTTIWCLPMAHCLSQYDFNSIQRAVIDMRQLIASVLLARCSLSWCIDVDQCIPYPYKTHDIINLDHCLFHTGLINLLYVINQSSVMCCISVFVW